MTKILVNIARNFYSQRENLWQKKMCGHVTTEVVDTSFGRDRSTVG